MRGSGLVTTVVQGERNGMKTSDVLWWSQLQSHGSHLSGTSMIGTEVAFIFRIVVVLQTCTVRVAAVY